jgi:myosin heavy subunit
MLKTIRGATDKEKADFLLEGIKSYQYLSNSTIKIQGLDEAEKYNHTIKAMHIMGISNGDIICQCSKREREYLWSVLT